jgi:energy-coupling factor transporter transmembrane protein EcfT
MEMRGFGAYPGRTSYFTLSLGRRDCFLLAVVFLLTILTIVIMASGVF